MEEKQSLPISNIPEDAPAPVVGKLPKCYGEIVNLADNAELCETFRSWASKNIERFKGQNARDNFVEDGGVLDINDRMWRVALNRDTTDDQTKDTLSNVTSPVFKVAVRVISAAENSIMFQDERLPAEFEPEINTTEYTEDDGKQIAEQQNALEQFVFDEDKRISKIKKLVEYVNKDQMRVALIEWVREVEDVTENVPNEKMGRNDNGTWNVVRPKTRSRVVRDWPVLTTSSVKDWFFDSNILDLQNQRCVAYKTRTGIEKLFALQEFGKILNVEKINRSNLYKGEGNNTEKVTENQQRNSGETGETGETGEIEVHRVWGRVPITVKKTPKTGKTKAKWDESKNIPELYETLWAGDIHSSGAICLKLTKLPHWHKEIPAKIIYSHEDEKGAFHTGYGQQMASLYAQARVNLNQAIDNVTERNWSPLILKGQLNSSNLTYKRNKTLKLSMGGSLERMKVDDTTKITMEMYRIIKEMIDDLIGTNKSMNGEYAGARTTATENVNVVGFASQPLDEQANYIMDQILPWMYRLDAMYLRQYADPDTVLSITHNDKIYEIYPTSLYGPIKTKITAMGRFKQSTLEKQGLAQILQSVIPLIGDAITQEGKRVLGREALRIYRFPKLNEIFPEYGNIEASAAANRAVQTILVQGEWVEPQEGEDQNAWLPVLKAGLRAAASLPQDDQPPKDNLDAMRTQIELREQMQTAKMEAGQKQLNAAPQEGMQGQGTGEQLSRLAQNPQ